MRQRLISAAVLVPVVVITFLLGNPWLQIALIALSATAAYEAAQLTRKAGLSANVVLAMIAPVLTGVAFVFVTDGTPLGLEEIAFVALAPIWLIVTAIDAMRHTDPKIGF